MYALSARGTEAHGRSRRTLLYPGRRSALGRFVPVVILMGRSCVTEPEPEGKLPSFLLRNVTAPLSESAYSVKLET